MESHRLCGLAFAVAQCIGVDADQDVRAGTIGEVNPRREIHIHFGTARQPHIDTSGPQQSCHLQRDIQHHIRLPQTADPNGTWIRPAVTWINHHPVAVARDHGQA